MSPRFDMHDRLAASLREARKQRGLSLDAVAKLSGVSRSMVSQVRLMVSHSSVVRLPRTARAFSRQGRFTEPFFQTSINNSMQQSEMRFSCKIKEK